MIVWVISSKCTIKSVNNKVTRVVIIKFTRKISNNRLWTSSGLRRRNSFNSWTFFSTRFSVCWFVHRSSMDTSVRLVPRVFLSIGPLGLLVNVNQTCFESITKIVQRIQRDLLADYNDIHGRNRLLLTYIHYECTLHTPTETGLTKSNRRVRPSGCSRSQCHFFEIRQSSSEFVVSATSCSAKYLESWSSQSDVISRRRIIAEHGRCWRCSRFTYRRRDENQPSAQSTSTRTSAIARWSDICVALDLVRVCFERERDDFAFDYYFRHFRLILSVFFRLAFTRRVSLPMGRLFGCDAWLRFWQQLVLLRVSGLFVLPFRLCVLLFESVLADQKYGTLSPFDESISNRSSTSFLLSFLWRHHHAASSNHSRSSRSTTSESTQWNRRETSFDSIEQFLSVLSQRLPVVDGSNLCLQSDQNLLQRSTSIGNETRAKDKSFSV